MNVSTEQLFTEARTQNGYLDTPVSDEQLHQLFDLLKWGPTSANCSPARFVFVHSAEARERLAACVSPGNQPKVLQAPVTAIIGMDMEFYERLPQLFPHTDARAWFVGKPEMIQATAFRNSSLQGGYLILAARALGIDSGAMSGFNNAAVDAAFFPDGKWKSNFLINLGYGDSTGNWPRGPRLPFHTMARID